MSESQVGKNGQYRMTIDSKYKKLATTRSDAKLLAVLAVSFVHPGRPCINAIASKVDHDTSASQMAVCQCREGMAFSSLDWHQSHRLLMVSQSLKREEEERALAPEICRLTSGSALSRLKRLCLAC